MGIHMNPLFFDLARATEAAAAADGMCRVVRHVEDAFELHYPPHGVLRFHPRGILDPEGTLEVYGTMAWLDNVDGDEPNTFEVSQNGAEVRVSWDGQTPIAIESLDALAAKLVQTMRDVPRAR